MRLSELEAWILSVVAIVEAGHLPEDSRIELKAQWPEPRKAARRLAGHANSAAADHILWIIGLQEAKGVVSFQPLDLATWHAEVSALFDGIAPELQEILVPTASGPVIGLLFSTARRPFVIANPAFGSVPGEVVEREVPWREGTRVRFARRSDLITLLVPSVRAPSLEVLRATAKLENNAGHERRAGEHYQAIQYEPHLAWSLSLRLYVTPRDPDLLVFPVHRTSLVLGTSAGTKAMRQLRYSVQYLHFSSGSRADSHTISCTSSEAIIEGPGVLEIAGRLYEPSYEHDIDDVITAHFTVGPAGTASRVEIAATASRAARGKYHKDHETTWEFDIRRGGA